MPAIVRSVLPLGLLLGAALPSPAGAPAAVRAWGRWAPGAPPSPPEHGTVVASLNGSSALLGAGDRHSVGVAVGQVISLGANTYEVNHGLVGISQNQIMGVSHSSPVISRRH